MKKLIALLLAAILLCGSAAMLCLVLGYDVPAGWDPACHALLAEKIFIPSFTGCSPADQSIPDGTVTNLGSVTLSKGLYLLFGTATFASNADGSRAVGFADSASELSADRYATVITAANTGAVTQIQLSWLLEVTAGSRTVYLNAVQTSGGPLNVTYPGIRVLRLR